MRRTMLAVPVVAVALSLAACGGSSDAGTSSSSTSSSSAPSSSASSTSASSSAAVSSADTTGPSPTASTITATGQTGDIGTQTPGVLKLAADFSSSPNQFLNNGKEDGLNPALCTAIAGKLGVRIEWTNLAFDGLIPGLQAGRYDALCTSVFITAEREKVMNMVPYVQWGNTMGVKKAAKAGYDCPKTPCWEAFAGKKVAAPSGGSEVAQLQEANKTLSPPMQILPFESNVQVYQALQNDSVDAAYVNDPQFAYFNKTNGDEYATVMTGVESRALALTTVKKNTALADALIRGLQAIKADGSYQKILKDWGIAGVDDFTINPAPAS
ncbi:transporter substrate-binding domain-containing protein [Nakamurella endophytica]|uniref:transporter substrate-binding domain-containing protein n=1 Tax=Nakamurella endophytica TaxID=1748367 RepID=UPI001E549D59|nr:transporter substrate-binding domain-containing protein [Nakamurella endophytica]